MDLNHAKGYKTKQKEILLSYLESVKGSHITANDIMKHFSVKGTHIGVTTIYRNLEKMIDSGLVRKYAVDGTNGAYYEYIGEDKDSHNPDCFHFKCEKCGMLIHFHCSELRCLQQHLLDDHRLDLNLLQSVLFGTCNQCTEGKDS